VARREDDRAVTKKALVLCLAVALAFPAIALALQRRTYFGPAAGGVNNAGVEISARLKNGSPVKIKLFKWENLLGTCSRGANGATTGQLSKAITVKDGAFSATQKLDHGATTVKVSGSFTHQNTRMKGKLRVRGDVAGCSGIDTGTVKWHAKQPKGQK
jgi:hypothetical protein